MIWYKISRWTSSVPLITPEVRSKIVGPGELYPGVLKKLVSELGTCSQCDNANIGHALSW